LAFIDWGQVLLGGMGAGLGTWFGAWAAFRHERKDRERREHREQGEALRRTLYVLLSQRTMLVNIRDQHLLRYQSDPLRHIMVPPFFIAPEELGLEFERLLFVLSTSEADLINRLEVANRGFRTILATISLRNDLHREGQSLLAKSGQTGSVDEDEIKRIIGPHIWAQLNDFTDYLFDALPKILNMIDNNYSGVEAVAKKEFPEIKLFKVDLLSP
jgi:hypothetical protein